MEAVSPQASVFPYYRGLLKLLCENLSQLHLVIVDDTVLNLKVLDRMLKRYKLDKVILANSGGEALVMLAKHEFDFVITDIQMPAGISGNELCEAIPDGNLERKPVVLGLTAEVSYNLDRHCLNSGVVYVLNKPITNTKLQEFFGTLLAI